MSFEIHSRRSYISRLSPVFLLRITAIPMKLSGPVRSNLQWTSAGACHRDNGDAVRNGHTPGALDLEIRSISGGLIDVRGEP
jgi:hypothetical protein